MSSLYFGIDLFYQFEASPRNDAVYTSTAAGGRGCVSNSGNPASNTQKRASPKYDDDISLLI